jgi:hypothetical protein
MVGACTPFFDPYTVVEVLNVIEALRASAWDLYPHDLRDVEIKYAARFAVLGPATVVRASERA